MLRGARGAARALPPACFNGLVNRPAPGWHASAGSYCSHASTSAAVFVQHSAPYPMPPRPPCAPPGPPPPPSAIPSPQVGMCPVSPERLPPATPPLHPPTSTSGTPAPPPKQPQPAAATASTAGSGPAAGAAASSLPTMTPPPSLPLPPLAASPDAVITHHLPLGPREAEELARQVRVAEAAVRAAREAAAGAPEQPAAAGQGSAASADKGRNQAAGGRKQQGPQQGRQQARGGWDDRHALVGGGPGCRVTGCVGRALVRSGQGCRSRRIGMRSNVWGKHTCSAWEVPSINLLLEVVLNFTLVLPTRVAV